MQNIYDDPDFFAGYAALRNAGHSLHETTIRPALRSLMPDVRGRRVVDVGCGDGWLCRLAAAAGAVSVIGIDPSQRMLELAGERTSDARIAYRRGFAEQAELGPQSADVVLSVLALHYVAHLDRALQRMAGWLAPGGELLVIVEHPLYLASVPDRGFGETEFGRRAYMLHSYALEGERRERWIVPGVQKHHRTVSSLVNSVSGAGLVIDRLAEPLPDPELVDEAERADADAAPIVLAILAHRPETGAPG